MSRGPEAAFWRRVRGAWKGHAVRIEAGVGECDPGTPDTVLSLGGKGGWVELKVWPDDVSVVQLAWHIDALEKGAYAMVLCDLGRGMVWLGSAEKYHEMVEGGIKANGALLHSALSVVESALTGGKSNGVVGRSSKGSR